MKNSYYITTPIYYVNDVPHLGHAYTTIAADTMARFKRLSGYEVFFLTGTDEHGKKIEKAALELGISPTELADRMVERFKELWQRLGISYNDFIRTTEKRHKRGVEAFYLATKEKGNIYSGFYEDWYCIPCESYFTQKELIGGKCPDCLRALERLKEETYYFRMSQYQEMLIQYIEKNPQFILPKTKRNEIISFLKEGLRDLSISRTTFSWGIETPGDPSHIIYVWFDALINYLTAIGYPDNQKLFERFWPADLHFIGKDILRFHAVYWPTFLFSIGLPLPKRIFAHGWWTVNGQKMSKSLGNVVDPFKIVAEFGVDPVRYYLLREIPFGVDGDFSIETLINRINSDLANDLGNLFSRSFAMVEKYLGGKVEKPDTIAGNDREISFTMTGLGKRVGDAMEEIAFQKALIFIWEGIGTINKYIDKTSPWLLIKDKENKKRIANILYNVLESLRIITILLSPFMPETAEKMWRALGMRNNLSSSRWLDTLKWRELEGKETMVKVEALFPRIESGIF